MIKKYNSLIIIYLLFCFSYYIKAIPFIVELDQSSIEFNIQEFRKEEVKGMFNKFDMQIEIEPKNKIIQSVQATINVRSIHTNSITRDKHLRHDKNFFNVKKYPYMTFQSKPFIKLSEKSITGNITLKNVTKTVNIPLMISSVKIANQTYLRIQSEFQLNRYDFNISAYPILIDKFATIRLDLILKK